MQTVSKPPRVVTFGEIMLRLSPPGHYRLTQATRFDATWGGAEANVAVSLARFGIEAEFITRLPENDIAQGCIESLRGLGVDTRRIARGGSRVGIYFVEHGASQRGDAVTYDRAGSAISQIGAGEVDWAAVFQSATWFHFTGITPALSDSAAAATREAVRAARQAGLTISCDLNFRKKLWSSEKAGRVMAELMGDVDLCIANEEDADKVFGIRADGADVASGAIDGGRYRDVAAKLTERFGFKAVAITLRESRSASRNGWSAMLFSESAATFSRRYEVDIVDRLGAGDAFAAGLIYSQIQGLAPREAVEFAAAAGCLKHSILGDFNLVRLAEVQALAGGDASGRVAR